MTPKPGKGRPTQTHKLVQLTGEDIWDAIERGEFIDASIVHSPWKPWAEMSGRKGMSINIPAKRAKTKEDYLALIDQAERDLAQLTPRYSRGATPEVKKLKAKLLAKIRELKQSIDPVKIALRRERNRRYLKKCLDRKRSKASQTSI